MEQEMEQEMTQESISWSPFNLSEPFLTVRQPKTLITAAETHES